jgi:hypothetical protein
MDAGTRVTGDAEGAAFEPAAHACDRRTIRACALAACGWGPDCSLARTPTKAGPHVPPTFIVCMWIHGTLHVARGKRKTAHTRFASKGV